MALRWLQAVPWEHRAVLRRGSVARTEQSNGDVAELPAWEGERAGTAETGLPWVMLGVSPFGSGGLELVSL